MEGRQIATRPEVFEPLHAMVEMNSDYKWCMFFLMVLGLWPYTNKKLRLLQNGIISLITCLTMIVQCIALFTVERRLFRLLRITSFISMSMVAFIKYHTLWYIINDVKTFLDQIRSEWQTNNNEILRIMQVHAFSGKRLIIIFAAFAYPSVCVIIIYHIFPIILDKIIPLNEPRPVKFAVDTDFFVDGKEHPILSAFLIYLAVIVFVTIFVGTESIIIMISSHVASLFEIISLFFEKAVLAESSASHLPRDCRNNESMSYIITGTKIHRTTLQFVRDVNIHCNISYGPVIIFGVIALSTHFFCLFHTMFQPADTRETILSVFLITSTLGYMFLMNFAVEKIISSADNIPLTTYNTNWYETSVSTQKLLQLIILYSNKGFRFTVLSVYVPSVEGFAMLLKASISYFTVLLSLQ